MIRRFAARPNVLVAAVVVVLALLSALGAIALSGTKTGVALALAAAAGPFAVYGALFAPFAFPFAAFVLLVPFDNLLSVAAFGTLTRALAVACGGAFVLYLLRTRRIIVPDRALVLWMLFCTWALASAMWAIDPEASYAHLFTLFQLLALYGVASIMPVARTSLGIVIAAVIASGASAGLYGAYVFHHAGAQVSANGRLFLANDTNIVDPNHFSAALILPIVMALVAVLGTTSKWMRFGLLVALIAMGGGIAVSGSRGGLLGVAAAVIYVFLRSQNRLQSALFGLGGLGIALAVYGNVLNRFSTAASSGGAGRTDIWRVGLSALHDHFWVGAGFSNFPLAFDRAFLTVSEHYYTNWHRAPHNILISAAVELGIVGLLLLLVAWREQFRSLAIVPRGHWLYSTRLGLEGALIGIFVAGMFLDVLTTKYLWLTFMLCALVRNASLAPEKVTQCAAPSSRTISRPLPQSS